MKFPKKESHRAGSLKQSNKVHKTGRHRSKGAIGKEFKGKADVKTLSKRAKRELGKEARRNQSLQVRRKKREEVFLKKRHLSGSSAAPILIAVIPLREDIDVSEITSLFTGVDETATVATSPHGIVHIGSPILKQRFALTTPPVGNTLATLDAAKVATTVLFVTKTDGDGEDRFVDDWGHEILVACLAQGLPTTVLALNGLETRVRPKKRHDVKASAQKTLAKYLPDEKLVVLDKSTDALGVLRKAGSQKQRSVAYRDRRPHLLAEEVQFQCDPDSPETGTLMVTGYLRGTTLSVNGLVHLPGLGEFQMSRIEASVDPYSLEKSSRADRNSMECQETDRVLEEADPKKQESLDMENTPDPMDAEQTWPTEEELAQAKNSRKIVKKVPKGTSEYQAAWIPDEDAESADDNDVDDEDDDSQMSVEKAQSDEESNEGQDEAGPEEYETITVSEYPLDQERYDKEFDLVEEREAIEKLREAKTDAQFPDEVDTPQNVSAKNRFAKYRGLESFRTSPWDPKENQPFEYSRIFQFENFERTRRRVFQNSEEQEGALPGWYVKLHIVNVRTEMFKAFLTLEDRPLIVFGLLQHERKMSLLNVVLKRTSENRDPIKSKERLVFQCGFRRFSACPIFSQHTNGNKHKYERYFQPDSVVVASMYAPITFNPCPVLCYIEKRNGSLELIATGNVLSVNPDRLVIKRVVLSGHPFKVHKRSAVIRFMFFNREDILWFKPVQLRTKYGRRGHIKEPLGSHGHMKCVFDGQLKSQDTVLMNLFKRVFPKWTYDPYTLTQDSSSSRPTDDVEME